MLSRLVSILLISYGSCKPVPPVLPEWTVECFSGISPDSPMKVYKWTPKNPVNLWELSGRFEGDLVGRRSLDPLSREERCLLRDGVNYWPNAIVPIDINYDEFGWKDRRTLKKALRIIEENTCIRFPEKLDNHTSYIMLKGNLGYGECWSYLGMIHGNQTLSLGEGCVDLHHTLHEILHALGLVHQHSAPDRDDYINIHWENIDPDFIEWFDKFTWLEYTDFGLGYDYYSVMHYSAYVGSKNGEPTISSKDPNVTIEERTTLSEKDIKKLNIMYCNGAPTQRTNINWTFGYFIVDLVDDFSPLCRCFIAVFTALYLLLVTSLLGKWIFSGILRRRSVITPNPEQNQAQDTIEKLENQFNK